MNPRSQLSVIALLLTASTVRAVSRPVHWTESAPPARVGACAVYDSLSDRIVLLGGAIGNYSYQQSRLPAWECTLGGTGIWQRSPLPSFPGADPATSLLDPVRREFWQFGGNLVGGPAARLGVAPGAPWKIVPLTIDAAADSWVAMAFDVAHDRILGLAHVFKFPHGDSLGLFEAPIADTLRFSRIPIAGPQPLGLFRLVVAWDRARAEFVVLAEDATAGTIPGIRILSTGQDPHWETIIPAADPVGGSPTNLYSAEAAQDPVSNELYLVENEYHLPNYAIEGQLWKLERGPSLHWVRLAPPPMTAEHPAVAVDTRRRQLVLLGGVDDRLVSHAAMQSFDFSTGAWTVTAPPVGPDTRNAYAAAYDHARDRVLLFGGISRRDFRLLDDLWSRTSRDGQWHRLEVAGTPPSGRENAVLVEDPARDRFLLVGGLVGAPSPVEVWELSHPSSPVWSLLVLDGVAPDRVDGAVLDEPRNRLIVHGAVSQPFEEAEWELTLGPSPRWRRLPVVGAASPPQQCGFTLDRARGRALLFGGYTGGIDQTISSDAVWGFALDADSVRWEQLSEQNERIRNVFYPYLNQGAIAVDPVRDRLISFGGIGSTSLLEQRSSEFAEALQLLPQLSDSPRWQDLDPVDGGPPPTSYKPIVYDPIRDAFLVFGAGELTSCGSTFELDGGHEGWPTVGAHVTGSMHSALRLEWTAPIGPSGVPVLRRLSGGAWANVGEAVRDTDGELRFTDAEIAAGAAVDYRLAWPVPGGDIPVGEVSLTVGVPAHAALAVRGNPTRAAIELDLDLPSAGPVHVQLVDLAGRIIAERRFEAGSAGRHPFVLVPPRGAPPGLYFVRVTSASGVATGRVTLLK